MYVQVLIVPDHAYSLQQGGQTWNSTTAQTNHNIFYGKTGSVH